MALSQWKEAILEGILMEIRGGVVMEKNLERLENLVEILHKEGTKVPESVKKAYCDVAVECTSRRLTYERDSKEAYVEAIKSIWVRRIMPLCDKVSCLVTRDLLNGCRKVWIANSDEKACKILIDEKTRDKALVSLSNVVLELNPKLVSEWNSNMDDDDDDDEIEIETSKESGETESIVNSKVSEEAMEEDKDTEGDRLSSGGSKAESLPVQIKTISTAVFDRALRKLRDRKIDLMNALKAGEPSNLDGKAVTEQENDAVDPSATNATLRSSLMERRSTAQTYEWKDSIDDSDEEMGDDGKRNNKSKRQRVVVSPLKKKQSPEGGGRRKKVPWSTAETLAVMKGYEKYGANWKQIKDENPVLDRRTNGDIKDKFRVEMRRQERNP